MNTIATQKQKRHEDGFFAALRMTNIAHAGCVIFRRLRRRAGHSERSEDGFFAALRMTNIAHAGCVIFRRLRRRAGHSERSEAE
jgi:hypothetical protein